MRSNYKELGEYIRPVDERNSDGSLGEDNLYGISVTKDFIEVGLEGGKGVIEALLLGLGEVEWQRCLEFFQVLVEGEVFFAKSGKILVEVATGTFGKDVFPDELSFQVEEHEA